MKTYEAPHGDPEEGETQQTLTVEPVTPQNIQQLRETRKQFTKKNWRLYTNHDPILAETMRRGITHTPEPGETGQRFYLIKLDGVTVGISNHTYYREGNRYCVRGGLIILDQYQRRGIATTYSHLSVRIATDMGAQWFHGQTRKHSPMHRVRHRQGWTTTEEFRHPHGERFVNIKKQLHPTPKKEET